MPAPYTPNVVNPFPGDVTNDLRAILSEVHQGCPTHEKVLAKAREIRNFYDGESEQYVPFRPAEDSLSWLTRPKRVSFITRQAVLKLTSHLYKVGPRARKIATDPDVSAWYGRVCKDVTINGVMQQADRLATLHGLCCLGIYPTGNPRRPINYHLFSREDFAFWANPDDPRVPTAVCTITRSNPKTVRYRLWTSSHFYTFYKGEAWGYQPGGWNVARYDPASSGEHGYGVLPFVFVNHELPTTDLETPGLGYLLAKINKALNIDKSNLALWVHCYARPIAFFSGVPPEWRPKHVDGGFIALPAKFDSTESGAIIPEARYLESSFDIGAVREYIRGEANQALAELDIPLTIAVQSDGGGGSMAQSGLAVAALDADLITYAKGRQPLFELHETALAALICRVAASRPESAGVSANALLAVAADPSLRLSWPEVQIDLPGQARDVADQFELDNGLSDPIEVLMHRRGLTEDEAIEHYRGVMRRRQIALALQADPEAIVPDPTPDDAPEPTTEEDATPVEPSDMGLVDSGQPSPMADPATNTITPTITVATAIHPNAPIPAILPGFNGQGTEM